MNGFWKTGERVFGKRASSTIESSGAHSATSAARLRVVGGTEAPDATSNIAPDSTSDAEMVWVSFGQDGPFREVTTLRVGSGDLVLVDLFDHDGALHSGAVDLRAVEHLATDGPRVSFSVMKDDEPEPVLCPEWAEDSAYAMSTFRLRMRHMSARRELPEATMDGMSAKSVETEHNRRHDLAVFRAVTEAGVHGLAPAAVDDRSSAMEITGRPRRTVIDEMGDRWADTARDATTLKDGQNDYGEYVEAIGARVFAAELMHHGMSTFKALDKGAELAMEALKIARAPDAIRAVATYIEDGNNVQSMTAHPGDRELAGFGRSPARDMVANFGLDPTNGILRKQALERLRPALPEPLRSKATAREMIATLGGKVVSIDRSRG